MRLQYVGLNVFFQAFFPPEYAFHPSISLQVQQFDASTARLSTLHIATILTELAAALD